MPLVLGVQPGIASLRVKNGYHFEFRAVVFTGLLILASSIALFASDDKEVSLSIHFLDGQTRFHVGQVIPVEMQFSASIPDFYEMSTANYDRSGRLNIEQFHVTPAGRDPLHHYYSEGVYFGGGLSSSQMLDAEPMVIREDLNEWVALDQPGHYSVYVTSGRISGRGTKGDEPVKLESNSLEFDVIEADAGWQSQELTSAVLVLDDDDSKPEQKAAFIRSLRFLDTPASIQELVRQLAKQADNGCWDCVAGLAGSLHQDLVVQALMQQMSVPDVAITQNYLSILTTLKFQLEHGVITPYPEHDEKQQRIWQESAQSRNLQMGQLEDTLYQQAANLVSVKFGVARAETVCTLLSRPTRARGNFNPAPLSAQEVAAAFNALSADEQWTLLSIFWERLKSNAMIAPLQRVIVQNVIPHQLLRDVALQRLYELDPQAGRVRILEEISHPHIDNGIFPVNGKTLGVLPEETLPQFDDLLAERLARKNNPTRELDAQLIGRYSTSTILTRVKTTYKNQLNQWDCVEEDGFVRYFLRVQPEYGVRRLSAAPSFCMQNSLPAAIRMNRWSEVEPSIIAGLNQPDLNRARQAAETLARYGGAKAKAAMWARIQNFHEQWAHRETELVNRADMSLEQADAMSFQYGLVESLGRAQAWLLSEEEITDLEKLTVGEERENVKQWHRKSPIELIISVGPDGPVQANIQQYWTQDIEALRKKLAQYDRGTRFVLSSSGTEEQLSVALRAVRDVAAEHGLIVESIGHQ